MGIPVKLQVFEGPLDLLMHLIEKNKVNIYDIPIVEITNQYLDYIRAMKENDLNVVSEFLVMAATLINIKCKMLLPKEVDEEGEEIDPRLELVEQLLQYKMYKFMSYELKDRYMESQKSFFKPPTVPDEVMSYSEPVDLEQLLSDVTLRKLQLVFKSVMAKRSDKIDPIRSKFGQIEKEDVNLPEKIAFIEMYALDREMFSFRELLEGQCTKMEVIVTFLAVLELMKMGKITICQEEIFDDILIIAA